MSAALIMGASGDIGEAIAFKLADEGYSLYLHYYKNNKKTLKILQKLQAKYPKQDFFMVSLDMTKEEMIPSFLEQLFQIDMIIFASGISYYTLVKDMTGQQLEELWQIHLKTPILLIKELEDKLAQNKRGRIIFIGSVYGKTGSAVESVYSALKAGQEIFAKSYAKEVATRKITVNTIAPGAIDTQMNSHFTFDEKRQLIEEIPAARLGKPSDVAHVTAFLAHKNSDYITGSTITVDGGWS